MRDTSTVVQGFCDSPELVYMLHGIAILIGPLPQKKGEKGTYST